MTFDTSFTIIVAMLLSGQEHKLAVLRLLNLGWVPELYWALNRVPLEKIFYVYALP